MAPGFPRVGRAAPLSYLCVYNVVYLRLCCSQERRSASRQQSSEIRSRASPSPRPAKIATSFPRGGCDVSTRRLRRQVSGALRAPLHIPLRAPPHAWSRGTCGTRNFRSSLRSLRARSGPRRVVRVSALTLALTPPQPELTLAMLALTLLPILTLALTSLAPLIP